MLPCVSRPARIEPAPKSTRCQDCGRRGQAVELGEVRVDEGVLRGERFEHGAARIPQHVVDEPSRLLDEIGGERLVAHARDAFGVGGGARIKVSGSHWP